MKGVYRIAILSFGLLTISGIPGQAATPTIAITPGTPQTLISGDIYQYGATSFTITGCGSCTDYEIEGIFNGRAGTEIEILDTASYIFTGNTNSTSNQTVTLDISVALSSASQGVTTVTNILAGADTKSGKASATYDTDVNSVLSDFSNSSTAGATSSLNNNSSVATIPKVSAGSSFSFEDQLNDTTKTSESSGYKLTLTDVTLLLNPAPEPASMALLATGLAGLTAARRRYSRRTKG